MLRFEKVSAAAAKSAGIDWELIKMPKRATVGSAGYDFYLPFGITLSPGEQILIPTGIRALMDKEYVLQIYPRSGLGFKYGVREVNTVGIIDSDYQYSDNEGHIMIKITADKEFSLNQGEAFAQGIFMKYATTDDDNTNGIRNGGFGSTSNK